MRIAIPPISQRLVDDQGRTVKEWYDKLKLIEKLQPLSDIVFPPDPAMVSSIDGATGAFTLGNGLSRSSQDLRVGLTRITASLGADVVLNNTAAYFDGPSIAQGTTGTWFVSGSVVVIDTSTVATINCKLWDGTTVISSASVRGAISVGLSMSVSGIITSPAGNLRISCQDVNATTGKILFNQSGNSKDSTITAVRIA